MIIITSIADRARSCEESLLM